MAPQEDNTLTHYNTAKSYFSISIINKILQDKTNIFNNLLHFSLRNYKNIMAT